jgi:hypothetical protein
VSVAALDPSIAEDDGEEEREGGGRGEKADLAKASPCFEHIAPVPGCSPPPVILPHLHHRSHCACAIAQAARGRGGQEKEGASGLRMAAGAAAACASPTAIMGICCCPPSCGADVVREGGCTIGPGFQVLHVDESLQKEQAHHMLVHNGN